MVRTQIQLTEDQSKTLKKMAREKNVAMAELIRRGVDMYIRAQEGLTLAERRQRALSIVGKFSSGVPDLGANHDKYLAEIYAEVGE